MKRTRVHDRLSNFDAAVQYLIWALEEIEKFGHPNAAFHARNALDELRGEVIPAALAYPKKK
jgi:hypothetical protein